MILYGTEEVKFSLLKAKSTDEYQEFSSNTDVCHIVYDYFELPDQL
jgi:hypothetical protein